MSPHRFRQYRAFDVIMQTGSVTRAAEAMHISQPAVSKLLQSLEDDLRIRLFDRSRRRLVPTAEAARLHREVEQLLLSANRVDRIASQIQGASGGEFRISALPMLGARFLPEAISQFCEQQTALRVSLEVDVSRQVRAQVLSGQADIGFAHLSSGEEHLVRQPMAFIPGVAILPHGHRLAALPTVSPGDFEGESFISLGRENRLRDLVDGLFEAHEVTRDTTVETNLFESACALVGSGLGVSVVDLISALSVKDHVVVRPLYPTVEFAVEIVRPISSAPSALVDSFINLVHERLEIYLRSTLVRPGDL
ncbi:LysR family transcriptional regulator [Sphingobium sp. SCG-1]|uniref:LysR substrate-binding domain-containing protein n=1 Tax=Sphingobium sp. SCG-1 TaxID=2072936 RepID=UPI000CD6BD0E|nr:LysR substrate-binding domain-containing protein [Sphingobium sp. SCG-1]AUW59787.1 LysR family transcriptional regulator [Sphingobium sp. SCG-1]